jgi:dihydroxyacetone kinase-like predicted kinase
MIKTVKRGNEPMGTQRNITAKQLKEMLISAAYAIGAHQQEVNELNVFPVPDGDTGTNMTMTMNAAKRELSRGDFQTVSEVADTAATALLRGARGNSGVILSLLFRGIAKGFSDKTEADSADLAAALSNGVDAAYKAVMKPAEGTTPHRRQGIGTGRTPGLLKRAWRGGYSRRGSGAVQSDA